MPGTEAPAVLRAGLCAGSREHEGEQSVKGDANFEEDREGIPAERCRQGGACVAPMCSAQLAAPRPFGDTSALAKVPSRWMSTALTRPLQFQLTIVACLARKRHFPS
jgi:hypothetical protein